MGFRGGSVGNSSSDCLGVNCEGDMGFRGGSVGNMLSDCLGV